MIGVGYFLNRSDIYNNNNSIKEVYMNNIIFLILSAAIAISLLNFLLNKGETCKPGVKVISNLGLLVAVVASLYFILNFNV